MSTVAAPNLGAQRHDGLDLLRGLTALAVFFFHLNKLPGAACVWLLSHRPSSLPRPFVKLGAMSYSFYLLHIPIRIYRLGKLPPGFGLTSLGGILQQGTVILIPLVLVPRFFIRVKKPRGRLLAPIALQPAPP